MKQNTQKNMTAIFAVLVAMAAGVAHGISWINTASGVLEDPANWSPQPLPPGHLTDPGEIADWFATTWNPSGEYLYFSDPTPGEIIVGGHRNFNSYVLEGSRSGTTTFSLDTGVEFSTDHLWPSGPTTWVLANGKWRAPNQFYTGYRSGNCTLVVTGPNSELIGTHNTAGLGIGFVGSGNHLVVSNEARVATTGPLTLATPQSYMLISGSNTFVSAGGNVSIGSSDCTATVEKKAVLNAFSLGVGAGNSFVVREGGAVTNGSISFGHFGSGAQITVSGTGSVLVGNLWLAWPQNNPFANGTDNTLEIYDGAHLSSGIVLIGENKCQTGNGVIVSGAGSTASIINLHVGNGSDAGFVTVADGAKMTVTQDVGIGYPHTYALSYTGTDSSSNTIVVTGAGSQLDAGGGGNGAFTVGHAGGGDNGMYVLDGAKLNAHSGIFTLGMRGSTGNVLRIENGAAYIAGLTIARYDKPETHPGGYYVTVAIQAANAGRVEIADATNTALSTSGNLEMYGASVLRFELGKDTPLRPADAPLAMIGYRVGAAGVGTLLNDGTMQLHIDARKLACAGGGSVALLEASAASKDALDDFAAGVNVTWGSGCTGTLSVEKETYDWYAHVLPGNYFHDRYRLVAEIPGNRGTMILLR